MYLANNIKSGITMGSTQMNSCDETESTILSLVEKAFTSAWTNPNNLSNNKRSSYFVSELSKEFEDRYKATALVQKTDPNGERHTGEWLLDIAIVKTKEVGTDYKNRKTTVVDSIIWAIESEFSTYIKEFCKDFTKLLYIKANGYLYIAGLNQTDKKARENYIEAQKKLATTLVESKEIKSPFFIVFIPSSGNGVWDEFKLEELISWFKCYKLA